MRKKVSHGKSCLIQHQSILALNAQTSHLCILTPSAFFPTTNGKTPKHAPESGYTLVVSTVRLLMKISNTLTSKKIFISKASGFGGAVVEEWRERKAW